MPLRWVATVWVFRFASMLFPHLDKSADLQYFISAYIAEPIVTFYLLFRTRTSIPNSKNLLRDEIRSIPIKKAGNDIILVFSIFQILIYSNIILLNYFNYFNKLGITFQGCATGLTRDPTSVLCVLATLGPMVLVPIAKEVFFRGWVLNRF